MATRTFGPRKPERRATQSGRLDQVVEQARRDQDERTKGYREISLKIHPWVCARCGREFSQENLHLLTVHHKDHNHDNNPPDGSNWENLCVYCHGNEHSRYLDHLAGGAEQAETADTGGKATHQPFAGLKDLLKLKES
jgi:5-methylcytosine-specific restriction endonuclease McrA